MLRWVFVFLVVALIAGVLGYSGIAGDFMYLAKILFYVFVVVFLASLIYGLIARRHTLR